MLTLMFQPSAAAVTDCFTPADGTSRSSRFQPAEQQVQQRRECMAAVAAAARRQRRGAPWGGNAAAAATKARVRLTFAEQGNAAARLGGQQRGGHVSPRVRPCWWAECVGRAIGLCEKAAGCRMWAPRRGCSMFMRPPAAAACPAAPWEQCRPCATAGIFASHTVWYSNPCVSSSAF